jgi:hypothetical protein
MQGCVTTSIFFRHVCACIHPVMAVSFILLLLCAPARSLLYIHTYTCWTIAGLRSFPPAWSKFSQFWGVQLNCIDAFLRNTVTCFALHSRLLKIVQTKTRNLFTRMVSLIYVIYWVPQIFPTSTLWHTQQSSVFRCMHQQFIYECSWQTSHTNKHVLMY